MTPPPDGVRWPVLASVLAGTFVGTINNSVANVAVLDVIDDFDLQIGAAVWFVTGYVLAFAVLMPAAGWLADTYGVRRVYLTGMACFGVASACVALAPSYPVAAAARIGQGIANAPVLPTVMLTVVLAFPPGVRGRAMGSWAAVNGAAVALGPPAGGWLTDAFGWRAVFWVDVPLAAVALVSAWRWLPASPARHDSRFDFAGGALLTGGLVATMVALSQGPDWGWAHPALPALLLSGSWLLARFWARCHRVRDPFVDITVLRNRRFATLATIAGLQMMAMFGVLFMTPLMLVARFELGIGTAGAVMFVMPLSMIVAGPWMGYLSDGRGARALTGAGALAMAVASVVMALGAVDRNLVLVVMGLVALGAGVSAIQAPTAVGVAEEVSDRNRGVAMGLFHTIRFVAGVLGAAIAAAVISALSHGGDLSGLSDRRLTLLFVTDLAVVATLALVAAAASRLLTNRRLVAPADLETERS